MIWKRQQDEQPISLEEIERQFAHQLNLIDVDKLVEQSVLLKEQIAEICQIREPSDEEVSKRAQLRQQLSKVEYNRDTHELRRFYQSMDMSFLEKERRSKSLRCLVPALAIFEMNARNCTVKVAMRAQKSPKVKMNPELWACFAQFQDLKKLAIRKRIQLLLFGWGGVTVVTFFMNIYRNQAATSASSVFAFGIGCLLVYLMSQGYETTIRLKATLPNIPDNITKLIEELPSRYSVYGVTESPEWAINTTVKVNTDEILLLIRGYSTFWLLGRFPIKKEAPI